MAATELNSQAYVTTPDTRLKYYWRFQGNSNTTIGSANGTDTAITYSDTYGKFGNGALFDGSTSLITGTLTMPTSAYTVMGWIYWTGATPDSNKRFFDTQNNPSTTTGMVLCYNPSSDKLLIYHNNGTSSLSNSMSGEVKAGLTHVAATWNGTTIKFYCNGVEVGSVSNSESITNGGNYDIGHGRATATFWDGRIDDMAVFDAALSATEVRDIALGTPPPILVLRG